MKKTIVNPSEIDLKAAYRMTNCCVTRGDMPTKASLSYLSNVLPPIIDLDELTKIPVPDGCKVQIHSKDIRIVVSTFRYCCVGAKHWYCKIIFYPIELTKNGRLVYDGYKGIELGDIFGQQYVHVKRPVTEDDLNDETADWVGFDIGDMTSRWDDPDNAIECAKAIVKLRFKNFGKVIVETE